MSKPRKRVSSTANSAVRKSSPARRKPPARSRPRLSPGWLLLELAALIGSAVLMVMAGLGIAAQRFGGQSFFANLLPFAGGVTLLVLIAATALSLWRSLRDAMLGIWHGLPGTLAVMIAAACAWYVAHQGHAPVFTHFRTLVGGKQQAELLTVQHQVYAAYRRQPGAGLQAMVLRAEPFKNDVEAAAAAFDLDANLLFGVAAAESSFQPRDSRDGGRGLFQITNVAEFLQRQARQKLAVDKLDLNQSRHNAFVAAATLKHYLVQMKDDLFLGLLAYNIGPRNGGLQFIMQQYGASDFVTMQPYLQQLPRDYPIRVLSYALAFKLWQQEGRLPAYEEGDNAARIQRVGIPGLDDRF